MRWYPMKQDDRRFLVTGFNVVNARAVDGHVMGEEGWRGGGCHRRTDQRNYKRESRGSKGESKIPFNSRHVAGRLNNSDFGKFSVSDKPLEPFDGFFCQTLLGSMRSDDLKSSRENR